MSIILAIETSTELASAALLHGEKILVRESAGVQTHSQVILPLVQQLLTEAGVTLRQCDAVAFGSGPGSFTGVRTACGIAQGLAFGAGLPVVPVITLQAMAHAARAITDSNDILAVLDARMDEVYWAQYHFENSWSAVIKPTLSTAATVKPTGKVVVCGNGLTAYSAAFAGQDFVISLPAIVPHASDIAQLAQVAHARGEAVCPSTAQPLYLRNKVALTTEERQARVTV